MSPLSSNPKPVIAALVPMRHHSERVPGKNYRPFAGQPLYRHIIRSLQACPLISQVVVNTDSPTIMEDLATYFPNVRVIERPAHLKADTIPMNDILLYDVSKVKADFYLQTHSTNPLLSTETIDEGIELYFHNLGTYDSLFSVTRHNARFYWNDGRPINHDPQELLRTQDLPPILEENSNLYIFSRESFKQSGNRRIGLRPYMFEISKFEAIDIDEEEDFLMAELLYQAKLNKL